MSSGEGPGWDLYPCYNWDEYRTLCNTRSYVRTKYSYCSDCVVCTLCSSSLSSSLNRISSEAYYLKARGYRSNAENIGSGLVSEAWENRIPSAEHGLASRMQDHYPCRNNCGNYVRVAHSLCMDCVASGHVNFLPQHRRTEPQS